ncbi:MAG: peptidoglycan DD-metalloendopeptidase family protein [Candidatus Cyclobacteriaceae bacterium M3_2C_046]
MNHSLNKVLSNHSGSFTPVMDGLADSLVQLDLSVQNQALRQLNIKDTEALHHYIFNCIKEQKGHVGWGGYGEHRGIYLRSSHYDGQEPRSIHLGIDLWVENLAPVYAPLAGIIHSLKDNTGFGNYGPTIILQHSLEGHIFYTLSGHLSRSSLEDKHPGQPVLAGQKIGFLGDSRENGDWPPHLHFQIISDLQGLYGDFPGVVAPSEKEKYLNLCPDPNFILNLNVLNTSN